jgi:transposase
MERRYALRADQWQRLQALGLPGERGHVGVTAKDNRLFVEAVLYRFRAGIPWRDLPERFGHWHRVYVRFHRWSKHGVWQRIFEELAKDSNNEYSMIDATVVRTQRSAAGAQRSAAGALKKGELPTRPKSDSVSGAVAAG